MFRYISFLLLPLLFIATNSCDRAPVFPIEPQIEFIDIQPTTVRHLQDSIVVKFRFQDGDGDLGASEVGQINLKLIDSRFEDGTLTEAQATNSFSIMNLTPDTRKPSIQGEITVRIEFTANLPGVLEEQIRYQIVMEDRAGNIATGLDGSEKVYTDLITIIR